MDSEEVTGLKTTNPTMHCDTKPEVFQSAGRCIVGRRKRLQKTQETDESTLLSLWLKQ